MKKKTRKPYRRRLRNLNDCRVFLADVINRLNRNEIDPGTASKLGYLCQVLARIIEGGDLEKRLEALEAKYEERN